MNTKNDKIAIKMGSTIRRLREMRGLSQKELAKRAGVEQSLISKVENNSANFSLNTLTSVASVLGISTKDLTDSKGLEKLVNLSDDVIINHLDDDMRQFIAKDDSAPYLEVAKKLYEVGYDAEELEALRIILTIRKNR